ncbi:MAG: AIR synthase-related protein [archaeon]
MVFSLSRIEVSFEDDARAKTAKKVVERAGFAKIKGVFLNDVYTVSSPFSEKELVQCADLLHNPVTQRFSIGKPLALAEFDWAIEIGFLPGVTDNVGKTAAETLGDFFGAKAKGLEVFSSRLFFLQGGFSEVEAKQIALLFANPLIQRVSVKSRQRFLQDNGMDVIAPRVNLQDEPKAGEVNLEVSEEELARIGRQGILDHVDEKGNEVRRGPLALDLASISAIRSYFRKQKRNPTDIELESIAQTWSEHCKHTIFAAELDEIKNGLFREKIRAATEKVRKARGARDNCVSVFVDNSGAIGFGKGFVVSDKVETHNSPSALDPFGGAITGIVGVNRDTIGFGMAAKPVVNRYGFCFADPKDLTFLYRAKGKKNPILPPERVMLGVIDGINVGGNCSGIPTPIGFMYFDERYKGKPLVFAGTVGLMPRIVCGKNGCEKKAMPGDAIVMAGGRVGLDGIHGATFSSEALSSGSPATAVQIGDPITQKKMSDAIVKEARDLGLYSSITDNGAGGLSCSVAEMAKECGGCIVDLEKVPLKYPGLSPWEIWVSESQERMTLAVPRENVSEFIDLMARRGVEAATIGEFNDSGRCVVNFKGRKIMDIEMDFLHNGLPRKTLSSRMAKSALKAPSFRRNEILSNDLLEMLSRLNICSREFVSAQYDHEVQGSSVLKPLQGRGRVNAEAGVARPLLESEKGVALSHALYPGYGDIDCYWMAACAIDSAIKNLVAVGAKPDGIVLLDNFCWCSSDEPERLWQLKRAAQACYDFAVAFGTPFISGKDSMFNDFKGFDAEGNAVKVSVPPTLLVSSLAVVDNVTNCVSMDAKAEGDLMYVLGSTMCELGASEYYRMKAGKSGKSAILGQVPNVDAAKAFGLYNALSAAIENGLVASAQPVGLGGLGVAIAKKCIAGRLGAKIELAKVPCVGIDSDDSLLFSESQSRFVVTVAPENKIAFERAMEGNRFACVGTIGGGRIEVQGLKGNTVVSLSISEAEEAYKKTLRGY